MFSSAVARDVETHLDLVELLFPLPSAGIVRHPLKNPSEGIDTRFRRER